MFSIKKILFGILPAAFLFTILFLSSCKKEDVAATDPALGLKKQAEGYAIGAAARVEVYTKETSINTGYTKFYIALYDSASGKRIDDAHVHLTPTMDMGMMKHSAPFEDPASEEAVDHLFPCSVVFIMPSTAGNWTVDIAVHNHLSGKEGTIKIPVTVTEPARSTMKSFSAVYDGNKYFIALIEPASPKVGINDMEIAIYKKSSMMSFPAESSFSVTLTPEMPSMGHGSPNNVNPVHVGNGHYKGKVNFTMTGLWKLNLGLMAGTTVVDDTQYFEVEF
jgi:YtkA-like